jgi:hypothetical protein
MQPTSWFRADRDFMFQFSKICIKVFLLKKKGRESLKKLY